MRQLPLCHRSSLNAHFRVTDLPLTEGFCYTGLFWEGNMPPNPAIPTITYWKMRLSDSGLSSASRDVIPKRSFISPGRNARCSMGPGKMRYTYTTCSASSKLFTIETQESDGRKLRNES